LISAVAGAFFQGYTAKLNKNSFKNHDGKYKQPVLHFVNPKCRYICHGITTASKVRYCRIFGAGRVAMNLNPAPHEHGRRPPAGSTQNVSWSPMFNRNRRLWGQVDLVFGFRSGFIASV